MYIQHDTNQSSQLIAGMTDKHRKNKTSNSLTSDTEASAEPYLNKLPKQKAVNL